MYRNDRIRISIKLGKKSYLLRVAQEVYFDFICCGEIFIMFEEYTKFENQMNKAITFLIEEYANVRAGRANPHILEKVTVEYYGVVTPITQVANVSVPEARMLVIQPWEPKILSEIEKAIHKSEPGLNPSNDGKVIRIVFPPLTEERRKQIVKTIRNTAENVRIQIRSVRHDGMNYFKNQKKNNEITEDEHKSKENAIQKLTDQKISQIEEILVKKEKEILEV